ncbi:MAG: glycosyltransferase [Candidatus Thermoplasmatota archaeon]|jgi:SAM-dependent methyltransferase/glycosyltransferase involved in cell wall biosynthesis|nr:glycosyltransferase [Candidatus Thermoplasmatota archaeon]MCL6002289.1 glycosyltransferase [Candidatus Thermoplasmatota archaeon]
MTEIFAITPTKGRPDSLPRALKSIFIQSLRPDKVILVGENNEDTSSLSTDINSELVTLVNQRTANMSGALNTALFYLVSINVDPDETYVAFLDDDDAWEGSYIEKCFDSATLNDSDLVVSGMVRHEIEDDIGRKQAIPHNLSSSSFLSTNPHVQGSNLFVRLSSILEAGAFDENLESTTDRDVCIRLFDLKGLKVSYVDEHLVHHYSTGKDRISSYGSERKRQGLIEFFRKYSSRMNAEERAQFKKRALDLFGFSENDLVKETKERPLMKQHQRKASSTAHSSSDLLIGFTCSNLDSTELLLKDIGQFLRVPKGKAIIVICDNSGDSQRLDTIAHTVSQKFVVRIVGKELIERDAANGNFGKYYEAGFRRKGIPFGRTVLHHYLYLESFDLTNPVIWILDDDVRLDDLGLNNTRLDEGEFMDYLSSLRSEGCSIAIGKISGDPPLPAASMVRTQLLDFLFNLQALTNPSSSTPKSQKKEAENGVISERYTDYYYDLTLRHYGHLEAPSWYVTDTEDTSASTLRHMLENFPLINSGVNLFRPVVPSSDQETTEGGIPVRGGNTLVFDPECLRTFPNIAPVTDRTTFRRGDTVWALLNQEVGGRNVLTRRKKVVSIPLSLRQDRRYGVDSKLALRTTIDDIYGASLVRTLKQFLTSTRERLGDGASAHDLLSSSSEQIDQLVSDFEARVKFRFNMLLMNSWRIRGLVGSIRKALEEMKTTPSTAGDLVRSYSGAVEETLQKIENEFSPPNLTGQMESLANARKELTEFLENLESYCVSYREKLPVHASTEEIEDAKNVIEKKFGRRRLRLLGEGSEGIVLSDGTRSYKYFHHGAQHFEHGRLELLRKIANSNLQLKHLAGIEKVVVSEGRVILVSSFVEGEMYHGGYLSSIMELLQECRAAGICLTNISPDNLIVSGSRVMYVDLGTSIVGFSDGYYDNMCRRAFLTYRWHFRSDFKELAHRTLKEYDMPELYGFEYFRSSLDAGSLHDRLYGLIEKIIRGLGPKTVLDYGTGNGWLADLISGQARVWVYDLDYEKFNKRHTGENRIKSMSESQINDNSAGRRKFDLVLANQVLCEVKDAEANKIMTNIRRLVKKGGRALIGVCNPFSNEQEESEHSLVASPLPEYSKLTRYEKIVKSTFKRREDYHRPFDWYSKLFTEAGFSIDEVHELPSLDFNNLSPGSDLMLFVLSPVMQVVNQNATLLIKISAMEWKTANMQIRHLVNQLDSPRAFRERVAVTDMEEEGFNRQYDEGDFENLIQTLDSLVAEGTLDRYLVLPDDPTIRKGISRRWFGLESDKVRSSNGQPILTTLYGFQNCRTKYVLQCDGDSIIWRDGPRSNFLQEMIDILENDERAISVSFPVAGSGERRESYYERVDWRIEVRNSLISLDRLEKFLPLENEVDEEGRLVFPWHRSIDRAILKDGLHSLRAPIGSTFFIHIPNERKSEFNDWFNIVKSLEIGNVFPPQKGRVDLVGSVADWSGERNEEVVVIIRGRDVPISKVRRCFDSLFSQRNQSFGMVFIDASSRNGMLEYVENLVFPGVRERMTIMRNLEALTPMENVNFAVRKICKNPNSIIAMVDADDALIGRDVVDTVVTKYREGADVTVGSMLRADKHSYYQVNFVNPRKNRGGNVWQHLRTFRKYLFDEIDEEDFKLDGKWIPQAEDWAFMIPIVEMAKSPVWIKQLIYFYDPSADKKKRSREENERIIGGILEKRGYYQNE